MPGKDIRIVILQRGWVFVGEFAQNGPNCSLSNANVVRIWGTNRGLGEIAKNGPTNRTELDPCQTVKFHELTVIATIECSEEKWNGKLS